uniref:non-specific serine/threonine protein kinase n=1 Tax=Macrostomum lignano TaxID=282301 RepID=A0A1I8GR64_9PLAT
MVRELLSRGDRGETYAEAVGEAEQLQAVKQIRLPWHLVEAGAHDKLETLTKACDKEAKKLCALDHKNVVKFKRIMVDKEQMCVTVQMSLLSGPVTLERHITAQQGLPEKSICNLTRQICDALSYLHGLNDPVIHRNINCKTVLVCPGDRIVIVNFGLAIQILQTVTEHPSTGERGDPHFMAPEMFLSSETEDPPYSCASDVWAFGCVIYQMVIAKRPYWECKNMLAIVRRVERQGAPVLPESCSANLKDFYNKCTEKQPSDRMLAIELMKHPLIYDQEQGGLTCKVPAFETEGQEEHELQFDGAHSHVRIGEEQVVASTSNKPESDIYAESITAKGLCLVISVETYNRSSSHNQQKEVKIITDTFENLGFTIQPCTSKPTSADIFAAVNKIVRSDLRDMGSFVCFIIGHGTGASFFASDGEEVEVRDIVARFRVNQCSFLKGKPKIFFVQTEQQPETLNACPLEETSFKLPEKDFLLCRGGSLGENGSLAEVLCSVVQEEKFSKEHIVNVVAEVNRRLGMPEMKGGSEKFGTEASAVTSLTKKFFLNSAASDDVQIFSSASPDKWSDAQLAALCRSQENTAHKFGTLNQTLLTIASARGKHDLVLSLLNRNSDTSLVSVQDVMGRTAISWAALKGHKEVLIAFEKILTNNASTMTTEVNRENNLRQTPLILAAINDQKSVLEQLIKMQADIDCQDVFKYSAAVHAAKKGHAGTFKMLCDFGANLWLKDCFGNTPLIWAARCGHIEVIEIFGELMKDANYWRLTGERNMNAYQWAKFSGHLNCSRLM